MKRLSRFALVVVLLLVSNTVMADQETDCMQLVKNASAVFKDKGRDYALKLINSSSGPFRKGELYVFALSSDGMGLGHPVNRDLLGVNQANMKDAHGMLFIQEFLKVAKEQGSGWVAYWWNRHGEKEPAAKKSYIMKVPGEDIVLGAGFYVK